MATNIFLKIKVREQWRGVRKPDNELKTPTAFFFEGGKVFKSLHYLMHFEILKSK